MVLIAEASAWPKPSSRSISVERDSLVADGLCEGALTLDSQAIELPLVDRAKIWACEAADSEPPGSAEPQRNASQGALP